MPSEQYDKDQLFEKGGWSVFKVKKTISFSESHDDSSKCLQLFVTHADESASRQLNRIKRKKTELLNALHSSLPKRRFLIKKCSSCHYHSTLFTCLLSHFDKWLNAFIYRFFVHVNKFREKNQSMPYAQKEWNKKSISICC